MLNAEDFRKIASDALRNKWGLAIGTGIVASLLGGTVVDGTRTNLVNVNINTHHAQQWVWPKSINDLKPWVIVLIILITIKIVTSIIIGGAVKLGYARFNLNLVDWKEAKFLDLFSQSDRIWAGFCLNFLQFFYTILWSLLLIIPGIIASYSYAMAPYIMLENPSLSANDAIDYSKEMMEGNKWRLFCLNLSFIGWAILCVFTLGIGFLWLNPYMEAAAAAFYRNISRSSNHEETTYI